MHSIFSHTHETYAELVKSGKNHARLLYQEWFQHGTNEGKDRHFLNAGKLLERLKVCTDFSLPLVVSRKDEGGTGKVVLETEDHLLIEMVLLPMRAGYTLCVSSQVGCRMGCAFCQTAKMGLKRNLEVKEIVAQVFLARHFFKIPPRNLVFMGMGEPLDNFENVMRAIEIINDPFGLNIAPKNITVSTSGLIDKIERLTKEGPKNLKLAVSLNGASDGIRGKLMPVNKLYNMEALKEAMLAYTSKKRKILIEYILIEGKTDSLEDAELLAAYLGDLSCTINLIPFNPIQKSPFRRSEPYQVTAFKKKLQERGFLVFVRETRGDSIMAACGQLGQKKGVGFFLPSS